MAIVSWRFRSTKERPAFYFTGGGFGGPTKIFLDFFSFFYARVVFEAATLRAFREIAQASDAEFGFP